MHARTSLLILGLSFSAPTALAQQFGFDDLGLPEGSVVTDQYEGLVFSTPGTGLTRLSLATDPLFPDTPLGLYNNSPAGGIQQGFTEPIIVDFADTQSFFGAFIDFGGVGTGIKLEAFDGANGTGTLLASNSVTSEIFLSVEAMGIKSVVFSQAGDLTATYLIDNLSFVPSPSVSALLTLAALGAPRRRRG